jgi:uncharacterized Fe-S center protein
MAKVFFSSDTKDAIELFDKLGIKFLTPDSLTAIKIHFGEMGNTAYLKPAMVQPVLEKIKATKTKAFLTDANTLYKGTRSNSVDHLKTAAAHGYSIEKTGLPVVIADGLDGKEYVKVAINQKHFKEVNIASAGVHADNMVVLTHFKGHELSGFGGALKNVGMGMGSRSGKQQMHSDVKPVVASDKCTTCGKCLKWCPTNAIEWKAPPVGGVNKKAFIMTEKCIGCGECIVTCNFDAIAVSWAGSSNAMQEKMVEYFYGVWKDKKDKMVFFNFIVDVSPDCDCYGWTKDPVVGDIGVLASTDPVALDQASIDMVNKKAGKDIFKTVHTGIDWNTQLAYAAKIGIGKREYELITL